MKKLLAILLAVCTLVSMPMSVFAYDLSPFENAEVMKVDVNEDMDVAFIESRLQVSDCAFVHKYESDYYYSTIKSDILVKRYSSSDPDPLFRTWIRYRADNKLNITAVTFVLNGKRYTFTDSTGLSSDAVVEHGAGEDICIIYGDANDDFFTEMLKETFSYMNTLQSGSEYIPDMKLILQGDEEIEVDVPSGFWTDMAGFAMIMLSYEDMNELDWLNNDAGTPCAVSAY